MSITALIVRKKKDLKSASPKKRDRLWQQLHVLMKAKQLRRVEREEEYQNDIRRRMALVLSGPDERARESIKARQGGALPDHGPLFAGAGE